MEATFDNRINLLSANVRSFVDSSVLYSITTTHNLWGRTVTLLKDANPALGTNSPIVGAIYWRERLFEVNGHRKSISDMKRKPPGFVAARDQPQSKSRASGKHRKSRSGSRAREDPRKKRERPHNASGRTNDKGTVKKSRSRTKGQQKKNEPSVAVAPGCLGLTRRSCILFTQIGLSDWWQSLTCNTRYWRWSTDRTEYELVYHHEQWKVVSFSSFFIITRLIHFPVDPKALINLVEDDDDEKSSQTVTVPAHPHSRRSTVSYAARDSGFSAITTTINKQHVRHSSAFFSIASLARFSQGDDEDMQDDEKRCQCEVQELDPEKLKEERRTQASLFIPYRNHLFHKNKPAVLKMKSEALLQDEVFLLLVLIYSETKRQDRTVSMMHFLNFAASDLNFFDAV